MCVGTVLSTYTEVFTTTLCPGHIHDELRYKYPHFTDKLMKVQEVKRLLFMSNKRQRGICNQCCSKEGIVQRTIFPEKLSLIWYQIRG